MTYFILNEIPGKLLRKWFCIFQTEGWLVLHNHTILSYLSRKLQFVNQTKTLILHQVSHKKIRKCINRGNSTNIRFTATTEYKQVSYRNCLKETFQTAINSCQPNLPIIHFHMLPIEEKYSRWNITDVKIVCINWSLVHIYQIYSSHFTQVRRGLRKLQMKREMEVTIQQVANVSSVKFLIGLSILFEKIPGPRTQPL